MFFFLSKILAFATKPFTIAMTLFLVAAFVRRQPLRKRLFVTGFSVLVFFSNQFIANEVMSLWEIPATPLKDLKKNYEWGILLTGVTKYNVGPEDRVYFSCGADRVTHTVQLYKLGKIRKIVVSGGSGRLDAPEKKEAFEVATALKLMGVLEDDILLESESRNTHESAQEVKKLLSDKADPSECILITSGYHLRRSLGCFRKAGLSVDMFSVDFRSHRRKFTFETLFIPASDALDNWNLIIKEWTGMVAYKIAGYI